jgi:hypothetical protein
MSSSVTVVVVVAVIGDDGRTALEIVGNRRRLLACERSTHVNVYMHAVGERQIDALAIDGRLVLVVDRRDVAQRKHEIARHQAAVERDEVGGDVQRAGQRLAARDDQRARERAKRHLIDRQAKRLEELGVALAQAPRGARARGEARRDRILLLAAARRLVRRGALGLGALARSASSSSARRVSSACR